MPPFPFFPALSPLITGRPFCLFVFFFFLPYARSMHSLAPSLVPSTDRGIGFGFAAATSLDARLPHATVRRTAPPATSCVHRF
ncbi:hypothetical protein B0T24DRAFT_619088 [Lasiosphaeria ovina]|uniref:Uncharacterized protein n=1 Tax=Lasiosphaeria ovina TaxID=92902 RepID=A0AAE0KH47_9PEZI|nr:hypothetical protein B0T24DRAFT_619088 [Lasiosphaeria ovina]